MEDENWLNKAFIECPNCKETLQVCDHSPYESSYRLYCDSCPKRVDIGLYESVYDEIENYNDLEYDQLLKEFESRLHHCDCGGQFKVDAQRRCLHCHHPLNLKEEQNVWLNDYWDESLGEEEEEKLAAKMAVFIVDARWKKAR